VTLTEKQKGIVEPVPGYKFSLLIIKLCVLIYVRTGCGLRTVVKILETFNEVTEGQCGKEPCYNTIEDWMKKLGLSVYENDRKPDKRSLRWSLMKVS
jgi:transposase-like protein